MKNLVRLSAAAITATVVLASTASAQVNFYTQGFFTGGGATCTMAAPAPGAPSGATCTTPTYSLTFAPRAQNPGPIASGSIVSLGSFNLVGLTPGNTTVAPSTVNFTLYIQQTAPTPGTGTTSGFISGQITVDQASGDLSTLVWRPTQFVNIDPVNYQLIFDNVGPGANTGIGIPINATRGIDALVTVSTVPEPGTYALMVAGLAGMGLVYRRRRSA